MIRKGDKVFIRKQFQDSGDEKYSRIALENESDGVVRVETQIPGLTINPVSFIEVHMLCEHANVDPYFEKCDDCGANFDEVSR